jgi:beta-galactosidase GanA
LSAQDEASNLTGLILGAAWYPEHWEESRWDTDLNVMQAESRGTPSVAASVWGARRSNSLLTLNAWGAKFSSKAR